jgi:UDP-N-acetylmuramoyl-L-alanyl-D-glutamate--2,6-diaminopimelate ligase
MELRKLLEGIDEFIVRSNIVENTNISHISEDSRDEMIDENALFFAIEGSSVDATKFIPDLIKKGCKSFVTNKNISIEGVNLLVVKEIRKVQALISKNFFNDPTSRIKVIGITGTKGKTTISYMVYNALKNVGMNGGLIGTIEYKVGGTSMPAVNTTPSPLQIYSLFNDIVNNGGEFVSMEVSSHALAMDRVFGIKFDVVGFTNLSREHLDFHKTMEEYFNAKMLLFKQLKEMNPDGYAIINIDTDWGQKAYKVAKSLGISAVTCSMERDDAYIRAKDINVSIDGTTLKFLVEDKDFKAKLKMTGIHNVYNAMMALAMSLKASEIQDVEKLIKGISNTTVDGRFQVLKSKRGFYVIVDYAHTPDSLEKTLTTARSFNPTKLTVVFGAGGDRDKGKRPMMGEIASKLADRIILTNDNPRTENPIRIIDDILSGIDKENFEKVLINEDRASAINEALKGATEGEIIVIAGKGHENYQIVGMEKIHFSDIEEVKKSRYF